MITILLYCIANRM